MTPLNKINSRTSRFRRVLSSAFLCALIAVATAFPGSAQEAPSPTPRPLDKGLPPASPIVDQLLQRLSLEAKVGQIMVVAFSGDTPTSDVLGLIDSQRVGGVILFQDNVGRGSPERVRSMTDSLQSRARAPQGGQGSDPGVPLLIAVDQEGGPVVRVGEAATLFPGAMALGASGSESLVMRSASAVARELRSLGINVNLGPVVDVNSNPQNPVIGTRSFGADPAMVGRLATAAIRGQQRAGVLAIAKHWPGHGDADVDSHLALPLLAHSRSRLDTIESPPFRAAVDAGVAGIMTAHLDVPVLTTGESANMPVSLSPKALAELRTLGRNLGSARFAGLRTPGWRARLQQALRAGLADPGQGGRLTLGFEVIYGHAFKPVPRFAVNAETHIDLQGMREVIRGGRRASGQ